MNMKIQKEELIAVLGQFNPWWRGDAIEDLPHWQRAAFGELKEWIVTPPAARAVLLSGARQVGKTTLLLQAISSLLKSGVAPGNILYATFDHPILKLAGIDAVLDAWREREPKQDGIEYLFIDEAQFVRDWGTWVKHQVDFNKQRRLVFTGSAMPLIQADQESGVGRWHTIRLTTLSFYEYLQLKKISLPALPTINSLREIGEWPDHQLLKVSEQASAYIAHFHDYLLRGGFPQTVNVETVTQAQKLLREDIIDKAIKRDMTVFFGVRHVLELEQTFLYLCRHDGGILDVGTLSSSLSKPRPTVNHFIDLLEATHLIYRLQPYGYGKEVLRGRHKIYLADAAIAPAVMMKGKTFLDDPSALGVAAESCVLKHLFARYYQNQARFTYWRGKKDREVDLIAEISGQTIPFEVKYRSANVSGNDIKGLIEFCEMKNTDRAYIVTKSLDDFGRMKDFKGKTSVIRIPATLLCYWMGEMELRQQKNGE